MRINPVEMRLEKVDLLGLLSGVFWGHGNGGATPVSRG